ncbi:hypothetical protein ES332_A10G134600v1 [Gossypium tomentosum]|uniref:Uncharacterized protein n=1 Tax=Gossypium tomentosum TaxID=34277 RepID=A0A5D2NPK1_GOSTO|nr:hypothetical protein ES332_A10G134600v1 [Gossypium tomentosum]
MSTSRVAFIMEMKFGLPRSIIYGSNQKLLREAIQTYPRILADGGSSYVILQALGQTGILYRQGRAFKIAFFHRKQIYQILTRIPKLRLWQRCSRLVKEQGTIFYIIWRCIGLLLRWEEQILEA